MHLAIIASHPIQYHAPWFRALSARIDLTVYFCHRQTAKQQGEAGYGTAFNWDIDLFSGYKSSFLTNVSRNPSVDSFHGCDTPFIGEDLIVPRPEALLLLGWNLKSYHQALAFAKRNNIPVIVRGDSQLETSRSPLKRAVKALLYPPFLRQFDAALYVGRRSERYFEHYKVPREKRFFVPHAIDEHYFTSRATAQTAQSLRDSIGASKDEKIVAFAGRLVPFKRVQDLVTAVGSLQGMGDPVRLVIAGAGPCEAGLRALALTKNVRIDFLGFLNQSEMPPFYALADVLVLPSDSNETWGLVVNEAITCGTQAIVSEAVGCAEDLKAFSPAVRTFPVGDIGQLTETLRVSLAQPSPPEALKAATAKYGMASAVSGVQEALAQTCRLARNASLPLPNE